MVVSNQSGSEINTILANTTTPLLKEFQKNQTDIGGIKKVLLDRNFFLPVTRELERHERELKEIKRILSSGTYVAKISDETGTFKRFEEVSEDNNTRQYIFVGLVTLSMMLVWRTLFG